MSGEGPQGSKQNGGESAKITDLTALEGEPTERADIEWGRGRAYAQKRR